MEVVGILVAMRVEGRAVWMREEESRATLAIEAGPLLQMLNIMQELSLSKQSISTNEFEIDGLEKEKLVGGKMLVA